MIILKGTLRQAGKVTFDEKVKTKVWIEHTTPRDKGVDDLRIEELFIEGDHMDKLPSPGKPIGITVRPYASGRDVRYSAYGISAS